MQSTWKCLGASSSNGSPESYEDRLYKNVDFLNAIDKFDKNIVKAKDLKDKSVPCFDLGLDDNVQTQTHHKRNPLLPTTKHTKDSLYMDVETEADLKVWIHLVNLRQAADDDDTDKN